jgi:hypothetical protein
VSLLRVLSFIQDGTVRFFNPLVLELNVECALEQMVI